MSFVIGSYQAVEHPGGGHRASAAGLWRGEDLRTLNEVAMTVLAADHAEATRLVVERVAAVRHPHLLPVVDVVDDDDRVAVVCPWPAGGRLAELVVRGGRLSASETLTVLIPLAAVLAAAHAAGRWHGGVCPEAVWFDAQGRPLLGALAVSRLIAELNDGLPAGSRDVAPEVVRGESPPGDRITQAADVFSLGSLALFCLTGRSAWPADGPADVLVQSAAGLWPDLPDDAAPPELIAVVREMLSEEPERRPSAASLGARLARVGDPAAIVFTAGPSPTPASASRWRGWSAADGPRTPARSGSVGRHSAVAGIPDGDDVETFGEVATGRDVRTVEVDRTIDVVGIPGRGAAGAPRDGSADGGNSTVDRSRRWSGRRAAMASWSEVFRRNTPLARAGIAMLAGLLVTVIALQVGAWWTGSEEPQALSAAIPGAGEPAGAASSVAPAQSGQTWVDVVSVLDAARAQALDAANPALLADVYLDSNSPAGAADAAVLAQLAASGLRVVDGVHQIVSVVPEAASGVADGNSVRLVVVDTLPSHPIVDAAGRQVGRTPARAEQRRILVVGLTGNGYRISSVEPG